MGFYSDRFRVQKRVRGADALIGFSGIRTSLYVIVPELIAAPVQSKVKSTLWWPDLNCGLNRKDCIFDGIRIRIRGLCLQGTYSHPLANVLTFLMPFVSNTEHI